MDETLVSNHSNKSYWLVTQRSNIGQREGINFGRHPPIYREKFKRKTKQTTAVSQSKRKKIEICELNKCREKENSRFFRTQSLINYGYPADLAFVLSYTKKALRFKNTVTHWLVLLLLFF